MQSLLRDDILQTNVATDIDQELQKVKTIYTDATFHVKKSEQAVQQDEQEFRGPKLSDILKKRNEIVSMVLIGGKKPPKGDWSRAISETS